MLDCWERDMINLFDTYYPNGYNRQTGGRGGFVQVIYEETRRRQSEAGKGEKNPFYNHHHTDEVKKKISQANKGRPSPQKK